MGSSQSDQRLEAQAVIDTFYTQLHEVATRLNEAAKPAHDAMIQFVSDFAKTVEPLHKAIEKAIPQLHAQLIIHTFGGAHGRMSRSVDAHCRQKDRQV